MKKLFALLAVFTLCVAALTGCGGSESSTSVPSEVEPVVQTSAPEAEIEEELYSQDVELTNGTGVAIVEIYISKSDVDNWEDELLDGKRFADGSSTTFITDELGTEDTTWDFLLIDEDGDMMEFYDINLSSAVSLKFHWGDGTTPSVTVKNADGSEFIEEGVFEEDYYSQNVVLYNGLGITIYELYISPSEDEMWGADLLEGREFAHDETRPFYTELVGTANATWDIKIVDVEGEYVTFAGVNFSSSEVIALAWDENGTPTAYMM